MTIANPSVPTTQAPSSHREDDGSAQCDACEHELADHDAIGLRFCRATQEQALTRSCLCAGVSRARESG